MKLYFDHVRGEWQLPGQQALAAVRVDVPGTPVDLAAWLAERRVRPDLTGSVCPKCGDRPRTAEALADSEDAAAIADWIFDRASTAQVEQLFAALGTRFHELRKAGVQ